MNTPTAGPRATLHVVRGGFLVVMWLALWGSVSVANLLSGLAVAVALMLVFPMGPSLVTPRRLRPVGIVAFLGFFLLRLVQASASMARIVLTPRDITRPGIVAVPLRTDDDALTTAVATFITLTPGTLTLEVKRRPRTLYIHVIQLDDPEAVRREVAAIEARAIRAFGSRAAREVLETEAAA